MQTGARCLPLSIRVNTGQTSGHDGTMRNPGETPSEKEWAMTRRNATMFVMCVAALIGFSFWRTSAQVPSSSSPHGRTNLPSLRVLGAAQQVRQDSVIDVRRYGAKGDGVVDDTDVDFFLKSELKADGSFGHHSDLGDTDLDTKVGFLDFKQLVNNWQGTGIGWNGGDFNGDGITNFEDFKILLAHWNPIGYVSGAEPASFAPVPEPTTLVLLGLGAAALIRRRRNA
jgi:hypothetical protein